MKKNVLLHISTRRGFTLIELLIVIAIIGILASVVLVSLSSARDKARAANFKSQVAALQAKAVISCDGAAVTTLNHAELGGNSASNYTLQAVTSSSCGPNGAGTFTFTVNNGITLPAVCTATVNATGVTFSGC